MKCLFSRVIRHGLVATLIAASLVTAAAVTSSAPAGAASAPAPVSCTTVAAGVGCSESQAIKTETCSGDANWGLQMFIPPTSLIGFLGPIITNIVNPILNIINPIICTFFAILMLPLNNLAASTAAAAGQNAQTPLSQADPVAAWFDPAPTNKNVVNQNTGAFPTCGSGAYNAGTNKNNCFDNSGANTLPAPSAGGGLALAAGQPQTTTGFASRDANTLYGSSAQTDSPNLTLGALALPLLNLVTIDKPAGPLSATSAPSPTSGQLPSYKAMVSGDPVKGDTKVKLLVNPLLAPDGLITVSSFGAAGNAPGVGRTAQAYFTPTNNPIGQIVSSLPANAGGNILKAVIQAAMSPDGSKLLVKIGLDPFSLIGAIPGAAPFTSAVSGAGLMPQLGTGLALSVGPGGRSSSTSAEAWGTMVGLGPYIDIGLPMGLGYLGTGGIGANSGGVPVPFDRTISADAKYAYSSSHVSTGVPTTTAASVTKAANPAGSGANVPANGNVASGTKVDLNATIAPNNAVGTVQFYDGANPVGAPVAVSGGSAVLPAVTLLDGTHAISAEFVPTDASKFTPSVSPALPFTIGVAGAKFTSVSLTVSDAATPVGSGTVRGDQGRVLQNSAVDLTATVTPITAGGTVQFYDGTTKIGAPVAVSAGGLATLANQKLFPLVNTVHKLSAALTPVAPYLQGTSPPITLYVGLLGVVPPNLK